jgi:hypothetical protein
MTLSIDVRRLAAAIAVATALFVALLVPQKADAYSAGKGADHVWVQISKAEIVGGATGAICRYYAGNWSWIVCPPVTATVQRIVGSNGGVKLTIYKTGKFTLATYR